MKGMKFFGIQRSLLTNLFNRNFSRGFRIEPTEFTTNYDHPPDSQYFKFEIEETSKGKINSILLFSEREQKTMIVAIDLILKYQFINFRFGTSYWINILCPIFIEFLQMESLIFPTLQVLLWKVKWERMSNLLVEKYILKACSFIFGWK